MVWAGHARIRSSGFVTFETIPEITSRFNTLARHMQERRRVGGFSMTNVGHVFAIYGASQEAELAVDELIGAGFEPWAITALFHDNQTSRDFAHRKNTRPPKGTVRGSTAGAPLDGTWGLREPGVGPIQGALEGALAGMGVPEEWARGAVLEGKVLVSAECRNPEHLLRAKEIFSKAAEETGRSEADNATLSV